MFNDDRVAYRTTEHKQKERLHVLINKEYLAIPKEYDKLIISLRIAYANEYSLDKADFVFGFIECLKVGL